MHSASPENRARPSHITALRAPMQQYGCNYLVRRTAEGPSNGIRRSGNSCRIMAVNQIHLVHQLPRRHPGLETLCVQIPG